MTREDLVEWLKAYECKQEPIEGINVTARQIKFVNEKNGRYAYIDLPIDDRQVPDYIVMHICGLLGIEYPDCVKHEEPRFNHLKDKYRRK
ncbi:MAG TPA: hypothetical protein PL009_13920 [Flavipsychrobacter sp.]|nr:hypothetical protein [Flavipsychrobacter sp.]